MNISTDAKILDRIKYAISELREAERLFAISTETDAGGNLPTIDEMYQSLVTATFHKFRGNRRDTAKSLGISDKNLRQKLVSYGLITVNKPEIEKPKTPID